MRDKVLKVLMTAKHVESNTVYEVLRIEMWQGDITYVELLSSNGDIIRLDDPMGLTYEFSQKMMTIEGVDYNIGKYFKE